MKQCVTCGVEKPLERFAKRKKSRDGRRHTCKDCQNKCSRRWNKKNSRKRRETEEKRREDPARKAYRRGWMLETKYNMTLEAFDALSEAQGHVCKICGEPEAPHLFVDHDHVTGEVRGLLCNKCNAGLGMFRDCPEHLENAAEYLRKN